MRRIVLLYGLLGGALIALLKLVEYRYLVLEHSLQIYGGIVAVLFTALGIWLGQKLTRTKEVVIVRNAKPFTIDKAALETLGITPREHEILTLIAAGLSNREVGQVVGRAEAHVAQIVHRAVVKLRRRFAHEETL